MTVDQLLNNAAELISQGHYRSSVMEAMTALEERTNDVVFRTLEGRRGLPTGLVKWLREKTRYSFDEKLHPVGEFALGKPIAKGEALWSNYKRARDLRNRVGHTAQVISRDEALFVLQTVREWLYFLEGAEDVSEQEGTSDQTMEFLSLYALFASRFRFRKDVGPIPLASAVNNALENGTLSRDSVTVAMRAVACRNRLAHSLPVSPTQLSAAIRDLKSLMAGLKGREIDASPMADQ